MNEKMILQTLEIQHREELIHTNIMVQEEERRRIAKDLHDDIGSKLNIIHLNLHQLKKFGNGREEFHSIVSDINTLIHKTIHTTRRISHDLLPPTLEDFGLVEALKELIDSLGHSKELEVCLEVEENERRASHKLLELNIFRVTQELINNSIKHGKPDNICIKITQKSEHIYLEYKDDGKGFDVKQLKAKKGLGLKNIESRLNMINATINYQSELDKGVHVKIECPAPMTTIPENQNNPLILPQELLHK